MANQGGGGTSIRLILICGATASGKSAVAIALAERIGGVVVNADALQVYGELRIVTARPSPAEESAAPHRLFGHVAAAERYSVGRWLGDVAAALAEVRAAGRTPILVGGTGLYFQALTGGLAPVPAIPAEVRARWRTEAERRPTAELHRELAERAPAEAARLRAGDTSRIVRALEVLDATGRTLAEWQGEATPPVVDGATAIRLVLDCERGELHRRIERRYAAMIDGGAAEEAAALARLGLDPALPAMKAVGLRPLLALAEGRMTLAEAQAAGAAETRRYAKRQATFFRHQMTDWARCEAGKAVERIVADLSRNDEPAR